MSSWQEHQRHLMPRVGALREIIGPDIVLDNRMERNINFITRNITKYGFVYHAHLDGLIIVFSKHQPKPKVVLRAHGIIFAKILHSSGVWVALTTEGEIYVRQQHVYGKLKLFLTDRMLDIVVIGNLLVALSCTSKLVVFPLEFAGRCSVEASRKLAYMEEDLSDIIKIASCDEKVYVLTSSGHLYRLTFDASSRQANLAPVCVVWEESIKDMAACANQVVVLTDTSNLYTFDVLHKGMILIDSFDVGCTPVTIDRLMSTEQAVLAIDVNDKVYPINRDIKKVYEARKTAILDKFNMVRENIHESKQQAFDLLRDNAYIVLRSQTYIRFNSNFLHNCLLFGDKDEDFYNRFWECLYNPKRKQSQCFNVNILCSQLEDPTLLDFVINGQSMLNTAHSFTNNQTTPINVMNSMQRVLKQSPINYVHQGMFRYRLRVSRFKLGQLANLFLNDPDLVLASIPFQVSVRANFVIQRLFRLTTAERAKLSPNFYRIIPEAIDGSRTNLTAVCNLLQPSKKNIILQVLDELYNKYHFSDTSLKVINAHRNELQQDVCTTVESIDVDNTYLSLVSPYYKTIASYEIPNNIVEDRNVMLVGGVGITKFCDYVKFFHCGRLPEGQELFDLFKFAVIHFDNEFAYYCFEQLLGDNSVESHSQFRELIDKYQSEVSTSKTKTKDDKAKGGKGKSSKKMNDEESLKRFLGNIRKML